MNLVDNKETRVSGNSREHGTHEPIVAEAFRRDQQNIAGVRCECSLRGVPVGAVRAIYGECSNADPRCRFYLIAHQREKRAYKNRWARSLFSEELCREEIYEAFAPACTLNDEHAAAPANNCVYCLPLAVSDSSLGAKHLFEKVFGVGK